MTEQTSPARIALDDIEDTMALTLKTPDVAIGNAGGTKVVRAITADGRVYAVTEWDNPFIPNADGTVTADNDWSICVYANDEAYGYGEDPIADYRIAPSLDALAAKLAAIKG